MDKDKKQCPGALVLPLGGERGSSSRGQWPMSVCRGGRVCPRLLSLLGCSAVRLLSGLCSSPYKTHWRRGLALLCLEASALLGPLPLLFQPVKVTAVHFLPAEKESESRPGPNPSPTVSCSWEPPPSCPSALTLRSFLGGQQDWVEALG